VEGEIEGDEAKHGGAQALTQALEEVGIHAALLVAGAWTKPDPASGSR